MGPSAKHSNTRSASGSFREWPTPLLGNRAIMKSQVKTLLQLLDTFQQAVQTFPEFRYAGDPILRKQTNKVDNTEGKEIGEKLGEVLLTYRQKFRMGRGLAAPQIGINKAVFVTYVNDTIEIFCNPRVVRKSNKTNYYRELCLSSGILAADVKRSEWIELEWLDVNSGELKSKKFDGFLARLIQHEEAHLRGLINLDEAEPGCIGYATFDPLQEKLRSEKLQTWS